MKMILNKIIVSIVSISVPGTCKWQQQRKSLKVNERWGQLSVIRRPYVSAY